MLLRLLTAALSAVVKQQPAPSHATMASASKSTEDRLVIMKSKYMDCVRATGSNECPMALVRRSSPGACPAEHS